MYLLYYSARAFWITRSLTLKTQSKLVQVKCFCLIHLLISGNSKCCICKCSHPMILFHSRPLCTYAILSAARVPRLREIENKDQSAEFFYHSEEHDRQQLSPQQAFILHSLTPTRSVDKAEICQNMKNHSIPPRGITLWYCVIEWHSHPTPI